MVGAAGARQRAWNGRGCGALAPGDRLRDRVAAVDGERLPRDEAGRRARQEEHHRGDLLGCPPAPERRAREMR